MAGGITVGQLQEGINLGGGGINFSIVGDMDSAKLDQFLTGKANDWGTTGVAGGTKTFDETTPLTGTKTFEFENNATAGSSTLDWVKVEEVIDAAYRGRIHEFQIQYQNEYLTSEVQLIMQAQTTGEEIYRENLIPFTNIDNKAQELSFRFRAPSDGLVDWGFHIINGNSSAKIRLDDVVITPILRETQETVFIEKEDSMVRVKGTGSGTGSIDTRVFRLEEIVEEKKGSAITVTNSSTLGTVFIIEESGIYHMDGSVSINSPAGEYIGFTKNNIINESFFGALNDDQILTIDRISAAGTEIVFATTVYLEKDDTVRMQAHGTVADFSRARCNISKTGSAHAFPALKDQKVEIPVSEVRIEGFGKGTGGEATTVAYSSTAKITGKSLAINNSNGTILNILKPGILHIYAGMNTGSTQRTINITLNASNPAVAPSLGEIVATLGLDAGGFEHSTFASIVVKAGDKIRVSTDAGTLQAGRAFLSAIHQEQEVSVAVNNIEPQYGEEDTYIKLGGSYNRASVNVNILYANTILELLGPAIEYIPSSINGDSFEILEDGVYSFSASWFGNGAGDIAFTKNASILNNSPSVLPQNEKLAISYNSAGTVMEVAGTALLVRGDIVRLHVGGVNETNTDYNTWSITKQANSSIIGIGGRPIDAYQQEPNSVLEMHTPIIGTALLGWSGLDKNIGSALSTADNNREVIINEDGLYHFTLNTYPSATINVAAIKNLATHTALGSDERLLALRSMIDGPAEYADMTWTSELKAGDVVRVAGDSNWTSSSPAHWRYRVQKLGSLKKAIPLIDSTVDIPASRVLLSGMTGNGSSPEAKTAQFDALSSISGEALSVNNANGTIITVVKDGFLYINSTVKPAGGTIWLTKNQVDPDADPTEIEKILTRGISNVELEGINWSGPVKAGDTYRVTGNVAFGTSINCRLDITHQETEVAVAISNVKPQFEDVDSTIRLARANGHGSTGTKIRRFSNAIELKGSSVGYADSATSGASFTIKEDGTYTISYNDGLGVAGYLLGISKNASSLTQSIAALAEPEILAISNPRGTDEDQSLSWSGFLKAGDIIRAHTSGDAERASLERTRFTISKQALPSIAEVDVTPFMDINSFSAPDVPKQYSELAGDFTVVNGGISWVTGTAVIVPYKTSDNAWRARLNITGTSSSTATANITIAGLIFKSDGQNHVLTSKAGGDSKQAFTNPNTSIISIDGVVATTNWAVSGDVELESKPTWAEDLSIVTTTDTETVYAVEDNENVFSAKIDSLGTIDSQSTSFIDSIVKNGSGEYTINFITGFFTETPSVTATIAVDGSPNIRRGCLIREESLTSFKIKTFYTDAADGQESDLSFNLIVQRQGADYRDLQKQIVSLKEFPKVNNTLTQTISHNSGGDSLLNRLNDLRFNLSNISTRGSSILEIVDNPGGNKTDFIATRDGRVNVALSAALLGINHVLRIELNGNIITMESAYSGDRAVSTSASFDIATGDIVTVSASEVINNATEVYLSLHAEAQELKSIGNLAGGDNVFSARVDVGGNIVSSSHDWIDNINHIGAGQYFVTYKTGFFSVIPAVALCVTAGGAPNIKVSEGSSGLSGFHIGIHDTSNTLADPEEFRIIVQRQGADYKDPQEHIIQLENFPRINRTLTELYTVPREALFWDTTGTVNEFDISLGSNSNNQLFIIEDTGGETRIRAKREIDITVTAFVRATLNTGMQIYNSLGGVLTSNQTGGSGKNADVTIRTKLAANDYLVANADGSENRQGGITILAKAQDLERIDNVEAAENVFSAHIINNGTATVGFQNVDFVQSATRNAAGDVAIVFVPGFFSVTPTAIINITNGADRTISASIVSTSGFNTRAHIASTGVDFDSDFDIIVQRQGSDYKNLADVVVALPESKVKYQTKLLTADVTTDTTISDLTFNNLTLGKTYRAYLQCEIKPTSDNNVQVNIVHNGNAIGQAHAGNGDAYNDRYKSHPTAIFVATATTLTFVSVGVGASAEIDGSNSFISTYARLEELPLHEQTNEW